MSSTACASVGRGERETMRRPESATGWRCGLLAAPKDAETTPAARSPPGRWRRWLQATENDEEAHEREPSGRRGWREQPGNRRELGEHLPWMR